MFETNSHLFLYSAALIVISYQIGSWIKEKRIHKVLLRKGLAKWKVLNNITGTPVLVIESFESERQELENLRKVLKEIGFWDTLHITTNQLIKQVESFIKRKGDN